ncbi:hypothetical protein [Lysobacter xanthus]
MIIAITTFLLPFAWAGTACADGLSESASVDPVAIAPVAIAPIDMSRSVVVTEAPPEADASVQTSLGAAVPADRLGDLRGGTDTLIQNTGLHGNVGGNSVVDTVSGANLVQGGSFGNAAGISTVIQNSGNNVLIQNSTTVSVQFAPNP